VRNYNLLWKQQNLIWKRQNLLWFSFQFKQFINYLILINLYFSIFVPS